MARDSSAGRRPTLYANHMNAKTTVATAAVRRMVSAGQDSAFLTATRGLNRCRGRGRPSVDASNLKRLMCHPHGAPQGLWLRLERSGPCRASVGVSEARRGPWNLENTRGAIARPSTVPKHRRQQTRCAMPSLARISPKSELAPITLDWELEFTRAPTKKALVYWRSLCRGRAMPARSDLSPRAMQAFLPYVSVVDVVPDRVHGFEYIVSLQGTHPTEVLGHVKGRRLGDVLSRELAERWRGCFEHARAAAAPVRLLTRASM